MIPHVALSFFQFIGHEIWHWRSGIGYQWWSGIGSVFTVKDLVILVVLWRLYRNLKNHLECHAEDCHRWGIHHVQGTHFRTCWPHHPTLSQHNRLSVPLHVIHAEHQASTKGAVKVREGN